MIYYKININNYVRHYINIYIYIFIKHLNLKDVKLDSLLKIYLK